jgi:hypothetical protein
MGLGCLHCSMVIDRCWHHRGLASWGRVDRRAHGDEATVDHRVPERGTTSQCGLGRDVHLLGDGGEGVAGDDGVVRVPYRIVGVHPCMVHLVIRKPRSGR